MPSKKNKKRAPSTSASASAPASASTSTETASRGGDEKENECVSTTTTTQGLSSLDCRNKEKGKQPAEFDERRESLIKVARARFQAMVAPDAISLPQIVSPSSYHSNLSGMMWVDSDAWSKESQDLFDLANDPNDYNNDLIDVTLLDLGVLRSLVRIIKACGEIIESSSGYPGTHIVWPFVQAIRIMARSFATKKNDAIGRMLTKTLKAEFELIVKMMVQFHVAPRNGDMGDTARLFFQNAMASPSVNKYLLRSHLLHEMWIEALWMKLDMIVYLERQSHPIPPKALEDLDATDFTIVGQLAGAICNAIALQDNMTEKQHTSAAGIGEKKWAAVFMSAHIHTYMLEVLEVGWRARKLPDEMACIVLHSLEMMARNSDSSTRITFFPVVPPCNQDDDMRMLRSLGLPVNSRRVSRRVVAERTCNALRAAERRWRSLIVGAGLMHPSGAVNLRALSLHNVLPKKNFVDETQTKREDGDFSTTCRDMGWSTYRADMTTGKRIDADYGKMIEQFKKGDVHTLTHSGIAMLSNLPSMVRACWNCQATETSELKFKSCPACHAAIYCSRACQKAHWRDHKTMCHEKK